MAGPQDFQVVSLCTQHPSCEKSGKLVIWINLSKLTRAEYPICPKCGSKVMYINRTELLRKVAESLDNCSTEALLTRALRDCISFTSTNGTRIETAPVQYYLDQVFAAKQKTAMKDFVAGIRGVLSGEDF